MKAAVELALVLGCAAVGAVATWKIAGPPDRSVACDPATIAPEEICLSTLQAEWPEGSYLWVDARPAEERQRDGGEMPGSVPLTTVGGGSFDEQVERNLEPLATAERAVVYCGSAGCGISKEVVKRLKELGMIREVRSLHGGWEALKAAGWINGSNPGS